MAFDTNGRPARTEKTKRVDVARQVDDPASIDYELSAEDIERIRNDAREMVAAEVRKQKEKALLDQYLKEERQSHVPTERLVPIFLQLAGFTNYIMLDGKQFFHNEVYHVTPSVAAVLAEQVARGWAHEELTEVRESKSRRKHHAPMGLGYGNFTGERAPRDLVFNSAQMAASPAETLLGTRLQA